jgi:RHS repeat-associated protein
VLPLVLTKSADPDALAASGEQYHDADNDAAFPTNGTVDGGDTLLARHETAYDNLGRVYWHDPLHRPIAVADYGTNGDGSLPQWPATPPQSSAEVLVATTGYNARGETFQTIDAAGKVDRRAYDHAGRITEQVENYKDSPSHDYESITTQWTYTPDGQVATLTFVNQQGGTPVNQVTRYAYGVTLAESSVARADLLRAVIYPDSQNSLAMPNGLPVFTDTGGYDRVEFCYNRQGQVVQKTDQNGTVHLFDHDKLGRLVWDRVPARGPGVQGHVRRIGRAYNVLGMLESITSYSDDRVGEGYVVNEVRLQYNGVGLPVSEFQEHQGNVTDMSLKVRYTYEDAVDGQNELTKGLRAKSVVYPDERVLRYEYGSAGDNDHLNRASFLADDAGGAVGTRLAEYQYLGLGGVVRVDCQRTSGSPVFRYDLATGSVPDPYAGLDRFGRVKDLAWKRNSDNTDLVRIRHGYDQSGNRKWRQDDKARAGSHNLDELYGYDTADRLTSLDRGWLNASQNGLNVTTFAQQWGLDAAGNWPSFKQDDNGLGWDLEQVRQHNAANELTALAGDTSQVAHDRAGNMTRVPKPGEWGAHYELAWDPWDRLVEVFDGQTQDLVAFYEYDGLHRRTVKECYVACPCGCCSGSSSCDCGGSSSSSSSGGSSSGSGSGSSGSSSGGCFTWKARHYYYSRAWQVLEERIEISDPESHISDRQYVWGLRYIDDCVLRDRDTDANGTLNERLYALQDANWNVVALADAGGTMQERYSYTAYGKCEFRDPSTFASRPSSLFDWTALYTGRELDVETGLYYYRARYYSTDLGRFVGRDPIEYAAGDANLYRYAANTPTSSMDPTGFAEPFRLHGLDARTGAQTQSSGTFKPTPTPAPAPGEMVPEPPSTWRVDPKKANCLGWGCQVGGALTDWDGRRNEHETGESLKHAIERLAGEECTIWTGHSFGDCVKHCKDSEFVTMVYVYRYDLAPPIDGRPRDPLTDNWYHCASPSGTTVNDYHSFYYDPGKGKWSYVPHWMDRNPKADQSIPGSPADYWKGKDLSKWPSLCCCKKKAGDARKHILDTCARARIRRATV